MFIAEELKVKVESLSTRTKTTLAPYLGIRFTHFSKDRVAAEMPVVAHLK